MNLRCHRKAENSPIENLAINIKENLTVGTKVDSFVRLRVPFNGKDFEQLTEVAVMHKQTKTKTIYTISSRFMFNNILGRNWDYRIINQEGDNCYIKTNTLKFYLRHRQELKEYEIKTDGQSEQLLLKSCSKSRGTQLVFSFVKCAGNHRVLQHLLNDPLL